MRPHFGSGRLKTAVPMLPPTWASSEVRRSTWPISAVVVDLPLVPVTATIFAPGTLRT